MNLSKKMLISLLLFLAGINFAHAAETKTNFIFVVALERETPDEPSAGWDPTLYKINFKEGNIVEKLKLTDNGVPRRCASISDSTIQVILADGIHGNGTRGGGDILTHKIIIDKKTMHIIQKNTEKGMEAYKKAGKFIPEEEKSESEKVIPKEYQKKEGETYLYTDTKNSKTFVLTGFNTKDIAVKILESHSYNELESIPLNPGDRKLGGFFGFELGDIVLIENRYLISLFNGASHVGYFASGYLMILDVDSKNVKYIEVGSDPARGIAY